MILDPTNPEHGLYFRGLNRASQPATLRVVALFFSERDANEHMDANPGHTLSAVIGTVFVMTRKDDPGVGRHPRRGRIQP